MLKELMNHNELGVKFYRDENGVIFVEDEKIGVTLKLSVYENIFIFHRQKNEVVANNKKKYQKNIRKQEHRNWNDKWFKFLLVQF